MEWRRRLNACGAIFFRGNEYAGSRSVPVHQRPDSRPGPYTGHTSAGHTSAPGLRRKAI